MSTKEAIEAARKALRASWKNFPGEILDDLGEIATRAAAPHIRRAALEEAAKDVRTPEPVAWRYRERVQDRWRLLRCKFEAEQLQDEGFLVEPLYAPATLDAAQARRDACRWAERAELAEMRSP